MSTRFHRQSPKDDLDLWSGDSQSIGFLLSSSTTYMWSLKAIRQTYTLACIVPNVSQAKCKISPWPFTLWPKNNRVPPLITNNIYLEFESDSAKTVVLIIPTCFTARVPKLTLTFDPVTQKSIGFLLSSSTTCMLFESYWVKTVLFIMPTWFHRLSAMLTLTFDPTP